MHHTKFSILPFCIPSSQMSNSVDALPPILLSQSGGAGQALESFYQWCKTMFSGIVLSFAFMLLVGH